MTLCDPKHPMMQAVPLNLYKCVCGLCLSQDFWFLWLIVGITNNWNSDAKNWNTRKATSSMLWLCMKVTQLFCQCWFDASKTSVSKIAMPKNWNSVIVFSPLLSSQKGVHLNHHKISHSFPENCRSTTKGFTVSPFLSHKLLSTPFHAFFLPKPGTYPEKSHIDFWKFPGWTITCSEVGWVCWACPKADSNRLEILNVSVDAFYTILPHQKSRSNPPPCHLTHNPCEIP